MRLTSVLSVFLSLAIISHGAPINFSKRSFGNESSPQAVNVFQELRTITQGTDKEAEGADLSVSAIEALFADAPACEQQDKADEIIDLGHTLGGEKEKQLIQIAITYRQLERNTPEVGQPSELCTKPPKNEEINGLIQAHDLADTTTPGATPNEPDPDEPDNATPNEPDPDEPDNATPNEPDPDEPDNATPNEPDPDEPDNATPNEPDPDEPDNATPNEPDPDEPDNATPNEPDPDEPDNATPNEPDPDEPDNATPNEPDPDEPDNATPNEPDPDEPDNATPNEQDPDDSAKPATTNEKDQDDSSSASNDDSGNVLPKDPDEDSENNNDGSSAKSNMPQDFA